MKKTAIFCATLVVIFFFVVIAHAANPSNGSSSTSKKSANATGKLDDAKQKVCKNKLKSINKRNTQLNKMAENMLDNFSAKATKVETYYTDTVLPSGKTVSNYDALLSDISTKKTAVETSLIEAKNYANNFSCIGDDPKGQLTQYRTSMQLAKQSLKNYRTSIKNLIVAVSTVADEDSNEAADENSQL